MKSASLIFVVLTIVLSPLFSQSGFEGNAILPGKAQSVSVEKSIWGVQMGISPLSFYNESKLSNSIALRSELSLGFAWDSGDSFQWAVVPYAVVEPRYYYNLKRRNNKGKRIDGNSGNYLSLNFGYNSDFIISSSDVTLFPGISMIPMYGIRRNIGQRFNFEFAFGLGYQWQYKHFERFNFQTNTPYTYSYTEQGAIVGLRLAIGYKF
jgi:hypothetical protein